MPASSDIRILRQMWAGNPPSVFILVGIVFVAVGYAWRFWAGGPVVLGLGIALLVGGGAYEAVWLHRRREQTPPK